MTITPYSTSPHIEHVVLAEQAKPQMATRIKERFFDAYNDRNIASIESLYSDDAVIHSKEGPIYGPAGMRKLITQWADAMPDGKLQVLHISEEDDVIIVHWRGTGTIENKIRDVAPTRKPVAFHGHTCFRCKDGKVIEHWANVDYRTLHAAAA